MRPLSIPQRVASIRKHLAEIHIARDHNDPVRASNHSAIIEDHLAEIEEDVKALNAAAGRILGP